MIPWVTDPSEQFAFSKDIFNPVHDSIEQWILDYESFVTSVEFALPAN